MAFAVAFVDSISATATIRLDLQAGPWTTLNSEHGTDFPPPPMRRAFASTLLRDGEPVTAAAYDNRIITLALALQAANHATAEIEMQKLARELDRTSNILRLDPDNGNPVFFSTFRVGGDYQPTHIVDGKYYFTIQIIAEPFAIGLREDTSPVTVTNDPAAGSNGMFFDVSSVKGDVPAPALIKNTSRLPGMGIVGLRSRGTPSDMTMFVQCENSTVVSLGTDTTNPGGGPDAAMSGTGTNNYVRTSFATATAMTLRMSYNLESLSPTDAQRKALRGRYRTLLIARKSGVTSDVTVHLKKANWTGLDVLLKPTTTRQIVDLGLLTFSGSYPSNPGSFGTEAPPSFEVFEIWASRTGGTDTVDWDFLLLMPADESLLIYSRLLAEDTAIDSLVDSGEDQVYGVENAADPFSGAATLVSGDGMTLVGGFPVVKPGLTNRFLFIESSGVTNSPPENHVKANTNSLSVHYWPRYLYVRPSGL